MNAVAIGALAIGASITVCALVQLVCRRPWRRDPAFEVWKSKHPALFGANLGSWLLLERWLVSSDVRSVSGVPIASPFEGSDATCELSLSRSLRSSGALHKIDHFRDAYVTRDDFRALKASGANTVRLPFGYWIVSSSVYPSEYHTGRGLAYLDEALKWAESESLHVILCLHGSPGGQSGAQTTGHEWPAWKPSDFDAHASVQILSIIASRYRSSAALIGIEVANEPEVGVRQLVPFYREAYAAIRSAGCKAENVAVLINPYPMGLAIFAAAWINVTMPVRLYPNIVLDLHVYYAFNPPLLDALLGSVERLTGCFVDLQTSLLAFMGRPTLVGEWSVVLPGGGTVGKEFAAMSASQKSAVETAFGARQQSAMEAQTGNMGSLFWSSKAPDVTGPNAWSWQSSLKQGWVTVPRTHARTRGCESLGRSEDS